MSESVTSEEYLAAAKVLRTLGLVTGDDLALKLEAKAAYQKDFDRYGGEKKVKDFAKFLDYCADNQNLSGLAQATRVLHYLSTMSFFEEVKVEVEYHGINEVPNKTLCKVKSHDEYFVFKTSTGEIYTRLARSISSHGKFVKASMYDETFWRKATFHKIASDLPDSLVV